MERIKIGDKISTKQKNLLLYLSLLSPVIRLFPISSVNFGGKSVWLSPVLALPVLFLIYMMMRRFMKNCSEGEGLGEMIIKSIGKTAGKAVLLLIGLWLVIYTGFVVRSSAERLISSIYPNGQKELFMITLLIAALWMAIGKLRSLGRMAELFSVILGAVLGTVLVVALFKIESKNILPVTIYDIDNIAFGAVPVVNVIGIGVYFDFLGKGDSDSKRSRLGVTILLIAIVMAIIVVTLGNIGEEMIKGLQHSFFVMIRDLKITGVAERIEALIIIMWVITDLLYVTVLLKICGEIAGAVVKKEKKKKYIIISAIISVIPWIFVVKDVFTLHFLSGIVIPIVNMLVIYGILPLVFVVGRIRQKI